MLNRVVLVGRLTKDPEYRVTPSGVSVTTFTLAINRTFTNAQGERQADFINCVTFKKQAENVNNFLSKGSLAGVDGRLQSRSYDNQEGRRIFVTEVICDSVQFLEPKGTRNDGSQYEEYTQNKTPNDYHQQNKKAQQSTPATNPFANADGPIDISDDDLPF
ncbi:single-stranded DNA-binding protein [Macrococcus epidermidis]|uniref:Single-stranded DNA-binding protein n=1 Tax=Macrococcus epidermidis TaxID=1902580 RepID=A0A327ZRL9_9STAP|nr:single-stranded DNA-binding protein [Macrococcus epidermidis]RAK44970.1 single-stranded DNA-binding protein [Macrococcus epidermidis]